MLASLAISDIVLVDRLDLAFRPGLAVLTGETGAGKSILLDALGLALGARADAALVRPGARTAASVAASFELPKGHPAFAALETHGLSAPEDGEPLILRRTLSADGKSRAFVNDQPVGVAVLRQIGEALVEIEGSRGDVGLMNPELHRDALDAFGRLEPQAAEVRAAHRAWRSAARALGEARAARDASRAEEEYWRHVTAELGALDPKPGEEQALAERRAVLMNAGKLVETVNAATESLTEGTGVEQRIAAARRILDRGIQGEARAAFEPALAALDRAADAAGEAVTALEKASGGLDLDPRALEVAEERLFALRAAARRHSCPVDALPQLAADFAARLAALEDGGAGLAKLTKAEAAARAAYMDAARALADGRAKAAQKLDKAVAAELPALRLDKASFKTMLEPLPEEAWSEHGTERVRFAVATNPGAEPGPIGRIASRGEMSRFLLALRVVLAEAGAVPTLVLDEIDAGVGGATAAAIGERLSRLGKRIQLLVVTHSPQVAACGATHWRVSKRAKGGATLTSAEALDGEARREEIARMLAGAKITDEARAAADSLMAVKAR
jgi:DNA repair protein RecN (Recombination protein N)